MDMCFSSTNSPRPQKGIERCADSEGDEEYSDAENLPGNPNSIAFESVEEPSHP